MVRLTGSNEVPLGHDWFLRMQEVKDRITRRRDEFTSNADHGIGDEPAPKTRRMTTGGRLRRQAAVGSDDNSDDWGPWQDSDADGIDDERQGSVVVVDSSDSSQLGVEPAATASSSGGACAPGRGGTTTNELATLQRQIDDVARGILESKASTATSSLGVIGGRPKR